MEALLGANPSNPSCDSVADLQAQLRDLFGSRVSETRAEHCSVTFALRSSTIFDVPVSEAENEVLHHASNIDPLLGGARSSVAVAETGNRGLVTRRISAIDALINQPLDDPVLQTSITRHIITALNEVDGSNWIVRQVSRAEQGWTFTYICKDSWQAWSRQTSKVPAKTLIGEWSEKAGQDPIHLSRPAFDCRGSLKIAFSKSSKTIDFKYEHTPMHKTVAQLIELLAPPPPAPVVKTPAKKPKEPKPPKEPRPPKEPKPKTPRPSKRRQAENGVPDGEGSQPKKRRKKKDSTAPTGPDGSVLPPEMPGALPVGDSSARQLYNVQTDFTGPTQPDGSSSNPEGLVSANVAAAADDGVHIHSILNLPPGEAARRRDLAIKLLSKAGVDPKTLSAEQFNIFANQSPELQQDSLAMLVKYGAERLRIVHPNKDGAGAGQSTPNRPSTPGSAGNATPASKPKRSRKKKSDAAASAPPEDGDVGVAGPGVTQTPEVAEKKPRSSRICDNCRLANVKGKCDKKKPSCSSCLLQGLQCVCSPSKPRQSKVMSAEQQAGGQSSAPIAIPDEEPEGLPSPGFHTEPASEPVHQTVHESMHETVSEQVQDPVHDHFNELPNETVNAQIPDTVPQEIESPSDTFAHSHGIYQHSSGMTFPQVGNNAATELPQSGISPSQMEYVSHSVSETPGNSLHSYTYPAPAERPTAEYTKQASTAVEQSQRADPVSQPPARRSLPTGQPAETSTSMSAQSNWQSMAGSSTAAVHGNRSSPMQSRAKKPVPASQPYGDLSQHTSSWTSADQASAHTTQPAVASPSQAAAQPDRSKSRQSNRAQTHTPVNSLSAARQSQPQAQQSLVDNSRYTSVAAAQQPMSTDNYSNYGQYPNAASAQSDSSGDRIAYQPYVTNHNSTSSNSYSSFDNYNTRLANTSSSIEASHNVATSYPSTSVAAPSSAQWGSAASTSQTRNPRPYNTTQAASAAPSYNVPSNSQQSQSLQGFKVRPQPQAHARSSSGMYAQHQQQQSQQPPQQPPQQQRQQQQSYSGYMNQQQSHAHAPSSTGRHQQGWYGFTAGAATNNPSSGYNSNTAAAATSGANAYSTTAVAAGSASHGGHGAHGPHASHAHGGNAHRSMNLSNHAYSNMDAAGDQALYDLLRSNPAG